MLPRWKLRRRRWRRGRSGREVSYYLPFVPITIPIVFRYLCTLGCLHASSSIVRATSTNHSSYSLHTSRICRIRSKGQLQMYTGDQNPLLTTTTNQASPSTNAASSSHPPPPPPYPPPTPPKGTHPAAAQSSTLGPSPPEPNPKIRLLPPPTPTLTPLPNHRKPKSPGSASPSTSPKAATTAR